MSEEKEEAVHEIVIIKRVSGGDEEGHHGGVWKVAFADFMTAMMAFFLVLWIVNSTTRETKTSLARYFNPIKLTESTAAKKGVTDSKEQQDELKPGSEENKDKNAKAKEGASNPPSKSDDSKEEHGANGQAGPMQAARNVGGATSAPQHAREQTQVDGKGGPGQSGEVFGARAKRQPDAFVDPYDRSTIQAAVQEASAAAANNIESENFKGELAEKLSGLESVLKGHLEVKSDPEGVLISLSDSLDFGMFSVGSPEPEMLLLRALPAIAATLKSRPGGIVIRGHTDARRYRGGSYDNWQLSSARAQAVFNALVRAGLDQKRLERIEGYADHKLKKANDPNAPENRRIEILLRRAQT